MNSESGRQEIFTVPQTLQSTLGNSDRKSKTASVCDIRSQQKTPPKKKNINTHSH